MWCSSGGGAVEPPWSMASFSGPESARAWTSHIVLRTIMPAHTQVVSVLLLHRRFLADQGPKTTTCISRMVCARIVVKAPTPSPSSKALTVGAPTTFRPTRRAQTIATRPVPDTRPTGVVPPKPDSTDIIFFLRPLLSAPLAPPRSLPALLRLVLPRDPPLLPLSHTRRPGDHHHHHRPLL